MSSFFKCQVVRRLHSTFALYGCKCNPKNKKKSRVSCKQFYIKASHERLLDEKNTLLLSAWKKSLRHDFPWQ